MWSVSSPEHVSNELAPKDAVDFQKIVHEGTGAEIIYLNNSTETTLHFLPGEQPTHYYTAQRVPSVKSV